MIAGIVGLGLISGSMAKAYAAAGHTVYACNRNRTILDFAILGGTVTAPLDETTIGQCDIILVGLPPEASIRWIEDHAHAFSPNTLVLDLCGTKRVVCNAIFPIAAKAGFSFVGGHPMAGTQFSGFKYSRANLFVGAPMVLVPPRYDNMDLLDRIKEALAPCEFGSFSVTTAAEHDKLIAFTSQMPHIMSNAFIKSPTALSHKGFSAGSYKDLTRVAWLNAQMWAELCMENRENMLYELGYYINSLQAYQKALQEKDLETLTTLLEEGKRRKEEVDG